MVKVLRASMGTLSSLKVPSNVKAVKKLFETCCKAYDSLVKVDKEKLHWTRLEYSIRCRYPDFILLVHKEGPWGMSLQEMSSATNQTLYGITVPVDHYLKSIGLMISECLAKGLNNGQNATILLKTSEKVQYISMLIRQLGLTGMCPRHRYKCICLF